MADPSTLWTDTLRDLDAAVASAALAERKDASLDELDAPARED